MALKFIGQALQEFQEQQFVSYTEFAGQPLARRDRLQSDARNPLRRSWR